MRYRVEFPMGTEVRVPRNCPRCLDPNPTESFGVSVTYHYPKTISTLSVAFPLCAPCHKRSFPSRLGKLVTYSCVWTIISFIAWMAIFFVFREWFTQFILPLGGIFVLLPLGVFCLAYLTNWVAKQRRWVRGYPPVKALQLPHQTRSSFKFLAVFSFFNEQYAEMFCQVNQGRMIAPSS